MPRSAPDGSRGASCVWNNGGAPFFGAAHAPAFVSAFVLHCSWRCALRRCSRFARGFRLAQPGEGSGEKRPRVRPLHAWDDLPDWITSLAFLKDNQHFVAGTYEQLLLFDARNEAAPKSEPLQPGYVKALALP